jgi:hypothetical protein
MSFASFHRYPFIPSLQSIYPFLSIVSNDVQTCTSWSGIVAFELRRHSLRAVSLVAFAYGVALLHSHMKYPRNIVLDHLPSQIVSFAEQWRVLTCVRTNTNVHAATQASLRDQRRKSKRIPPRSCPHVHILRVLNTDLDRIPGPLDRTSTKLRI